MRLLKSALLSALQLTLLSCGSVEAEVVNGESEPPPELGPVERALVREAWEAFWLLTEPGAIGDWGTQVEERVTSSAVKGCPLITDEPALEAAVEQALFPSCQPPSEGCVTVVFAQGWSGPCAAGGVEASGALAIGRSTLDDWGWFFEWHLRLEASEFVLGTPEEKVVDADGLIRFDHELDEDERNEDWSFSVDFRGAAPDALSVLLGAGQVALELDGEGLRNCGWFCEYANEVRSLAGSATGVRRSFLFDVRFGQSIYGEPFYGECVNYGTGVSGTLVVVDESENLEVRFDAPHGTWDEDCWPCGRVFRGDLDLGRFCPWEPDQG